MIGEQIKKLRIQKGLSSAELARRSEISKSMVSQIEHGNVNPSVETIRSIAAALEEPMFVLFLEEGNYPSTIVRKSERLHFRIAGSDIERQMLTHDLNRAMVLLMYRIPPGAKSSPTPGSHQGEECVLVLKGELTIHLQDQTHTLEAGDTIYYDSRLDHLVANDSGEDVEILVVATPPGLRGDPVRD